MLYISTLLSFVLPSSAGPSEFFICDSFIGIVFKKYKRIYTDFN